MTSASCHAIRAIRFRDEYPDPFAIGSLPDQMSENRSVSDLIVTRKAPTIDPVDFTKVDPRERVSVFFSMLHPGIEYTPHTAAERAGCHSSTAARWLIYLRDSGKVECLRYARGSIPAIYRKSE